VLQRLNSAVKLIQRTTRRLLKDDMNYFGLGVHKRRKISYCVKDPATHVYQEGKIGSTRRELNPQSLRAAPMNSMKNNP
jgi:hypothetical protein